MSGTGKSLPNPKALWVSDDPALWAAVRSQYQAAIKVSSTRGKSKAALPELDRWFLTELAPSVATAGDTVVTGTEGHEDGGGGGGARTGGGSGSGGGERKAPAPCITKEQLAKLVEWKMARGQWRPRLLNYAREQPPGAVEEASGRALAALAEYPLEGPPPPADQPGPGPGPGDGSRGRGAGSGGAAGEGSSAAAAAQKLRVAVEALTALKGVGPATASALLAAANPHVPFMGDEALATCLPPGRQSDYSLKALLELTALLQDKARRLSAQAAAEGTSGGAAVAPDSGAAAVEDSAAADAVTGGAGAVGGGEGPQGPVRAGEGVLRWQQREGWSAAEVERCLWVASVLGDAGGQAGAKGGGSGALGAAARGGGAGVEGGRKGSMSDTGRTAKRSKR